MAYRPSVLCPVDLSEPSRAALRYAAAVADHFGAKLTVVTVDDPLLTEVAATTGFVPSLAQETEGELRKFVCRTLAQPASGAMTSRIACCASPARSCSLFRRCRPRPVRLRAPAA
jgi:nucleotide-binding universal stress UspA family protein